MSECIVYRQMPTHHTLIELSYDATVFYYKPYDLEQNTSIKSNGEKVNNDGPNVFYLIINLQKANSLKYLKTSLFSFIIQGHR